MIHEKAPLVSVVVTCFNSERYVARTIESILANARDDLPIEIIAVDDRSTDRTVEVLEAFGERVRLVAKSVNEGVSSARNAGIAAARGELVAFCDHDDLWEPEKLRLQLERFKRPEVGLVCTDALCFNDGGVINPSMAGRWLRRGRVFPQLLQMNFVITSSVVMRRSVFDQAGVFDPAISHSEDLDLWLRVSRVCEIDHVNQVLVRYRSSESGLSRSKLKMKASRTKIIQHYASLLEDRKLARKAIGDALYIYGMDYWWDRNLPQAREKLGEALRHDPLNGRYLARYLGTFVSLQWRDRFARLKRTFSRLPSAVTF